MENLSLYTVDNVVAPVVLPIEAVSAIQRAKSWSSYCTPPDVVTDGNTIAWYDAADLTTITKDGSNLVSQWNDKLAGGYNLVQADTGLQPLYSDGEIIFNNKLMAVATFSAAQPPTTWYLIFKVITDRAGAVHFKALNQLFVAQSPLQNPPSARFTSGIYTPYISMAASAWHVIIMKTTGTEAWIQLNDDTRLSNTGTGQRIGQPFTVGQAAGWPYAGAHISFKEIICRHIDETDENINLFKEYLKKKVA